MNFASPYHAVPIARVRAGQISDVFFHYGNTFVLGFDANFAGDEKQLQRVKTQLDVTAVVPRGKPPILRGVSYLAKTGQTR
jgi:hypothetical protein